MMFVASRKCIVNSCSSLGVRKPFHHIFCTVTNQTTKKSKPLRNLILGATGVLLCGYGYRYATDEGTRRSLEFWRVIAPIYLHYRSVQFLNRDLGVVSDDVADPYYEELHKKYTGDCKDITYRLRGFYLKNSQVLSTQDGFVPDAYMDWMKETQDNVPSEFKGTEARAFCAKCMKKELNLNFDDIFSYWEDEPIGVASIGEVHRARLKSNNKLVAVKLQFPNMEVRFRADIKTIKDFCDFAMPQHSTAFAEMEKQFVTEFDYRGEAQNLLAIREPVMKEYGAYVEIPKPYMDLCSKHILVMDFLEGKRLVDGIRDEYRVLAHSMGKTLEDLENEKKQDILSGKFHFLNIEEDKQQNIQIQRMLFVQDCMKWNNIKSFVLNNLTPMPYIYNTTYPYEWTKCSLNLGKLIEILCKVHGYELFQLGLFNGDPHPGNILLLSDGRLGLIDYGQVKAMELPHRINFAKAIIAHYHYDKEEVARIYFDDCQTKTKYSKRDIAYLHSAFWNDRDTSDVCGNMNLQTFMDWCEEQDPMVKLPDEYLFAGRISVLLRGMGNAFGIKLRMSELWLDYATKLLESEGIEYTPPIVKQQQQEQNKKIQV